MAMVPTKSGFSLKLLWSKESFDFYVFIILLIVSIQIVGLKKFEFEIVDTSFEPVTLPFDFFHCLGRAREKTNG